MCARWRLGGLQCQRAALRATCLHAHRDDWRAFSCSASPACLLRNQKTSHSKASAKNRLGCKTCEAGLSACRSTHKHFQMEVVLGEKCCKRLCEFIRPRMLEENSRLCVRHEPTRSLPTPPTLSAGVRFGRGGGLSRTRRSRLRVEESADGGSF